MLFTPFVPSLPAQRIQICRMKTAACFSTVIIGKFPTKLFPIRAKRAKNGVMHLQMLSQISVEAHPVKHFERPTHTQPKSYLLLPGGDGKAQYLLRRWKASLWQR